MIKDYIFLPEYYHWEYTHILGTLIIYKNIISYPPPPEIPTHASAYYNRPQTSLWPGDFPLNALTRYLCFNNGCLACYRYDAKKGFFCKVLDGGGNKCLGKGKGRQYATMDAESYKYLREYYMPYNTALVKLLRKLEHTTIPQWLKDDLSYSSTWHLLRMRVLSITCTVVF